MKSKISGRITVPVAVMEFDVGGNTIWVQSINGTVLRLKITGSISVEVCGDNPCSHLDVTVRDSVTVCLHKSDVPES